MFESKKLILIISIIFILFITPVFAEDANTNTWYVGENDINGDGSENNPFNNITQKVKIISH